MVKAMEEKTSDQSSEKLPISEFYRVIDSVTIFRNDKWWEAIALIESYGKYRV